MSEHTLQAIKFDKSAVRLDILDQLLLPYATKYIAIESIEAGFQAIKKMQVRGAPAIAIVGAFSVVVDVHRALKDGEKRTVAQLVQQIDYLETSRPTAVNLLNALSDIRKKLTVDQLASANVDKGVFDLLFNYAVALFEDDLENNYKIGENGLQYITETLEKQAFEGPFSIVTICNTGSLATSGHGTALGVIRSVFQKLSKDAQKPFWLEKVYPLETRPYNQGAKLTSYELNYEKIPFTLICDNMASSLISSLHKQGQAPVKFIIAGADRVVENGDSANKIGTFQLATIASYFNSKNTAQRDQIKFLIAAPRTTIDLNTKTGDEIVIEERPSNELTTLTGPLLKDGVAGEKVTVGIATPGISVWNPAFDVTPHELIDSIVTEELAVVKKNGKFDLHAI